MQPDFTTAVEDNEWNELYGIKKKNLNARDLLDALVNIGVDVLRIIASSLLVVMVPQNCNGSTCSIRENFEDLTDINKAAIGMNFITLGSMLILYLVIGKREKYLIYRMDENPKVPKTNYFNVFTNNPEIEAGVFKYNRMMRFIAIIAAVLYLANMVISGIVIFLYYYDGYQSVIQFMVNSGLCIYLIYRSIVHSNSKLVLSNTSFLPIAYNDIDADYSMKKKDSTGVVYLDV